MELVSCGLLRHVQQEVLIARFHFREEPAQFGEVIGLCASASNSSLSFGGFSLLIQQQLHHHETSGTLEPPKPVPSSLVFNGRNCMPIFHARDVATEQACPLFNLACESFCDSRSSFKRYPITIHSLLTSISESRYWLDSGVIIT